MPIRKVTKAELVDVDQAGQPETDSFSEQLHTELRLLGVGGLSPASALRFLTHLITESASADKNRIEKLKMMDKLLNTGRALMETGIKHEETAPILGRLEQLEARLEQLQKRGQRRPSLPIWGHGGPPLPAGENVFITNVENTDIALQPPGPRRGRSGQV